MIRPRNETEDLLLSFTKNCETLLEQFHRKAEETLEFQMIKPGEIFHFNPPIQIKGDWMLVLTDLEAYSSIFNITDENIKFKVHKVRDKKLVVFQTQKSVMKMRETWIFQLLQPPKYKMT